MPGPRQIPQNRFLTSHAGLLYTGLFVKNICLPNDPDAFIFSAVLFLKGYVGALIFAWYRAAIGVKTFFV